MNLQLKQIAAYFGILIISIGLSFCTKNEVSTLKNNTVLGQDVELNASLRSGICLFKHIACWDEWGRAHLECNGWGLCNYEGCFYNCNEDPPCCNTSSMTVGIAEFDINDDQYYITISLSQFDTAAVSAALAERPLFIDNPIIVQDSFEGYLCTMTIDSGSYQYFPNIGTGIIGGYKIPIEVSQY
ncbi:MAG: hypothetical protein KA479_08885 [Saprospiraceae bacterium]|nr:hypothetical protein [Saprospiraceae bacterium]